MTHTYRILAAAILTATAVVTSPSATAAPPGCQIDMWGFLGSQRRGICDGPIRADGSWMRNRIIAIPAHQVPFSCYTSGGSYYSSTSCSGGYFQPYTELSDEVYPVTDATVLPDEPGHLS